MLETALPLAREVLGDRHPQTQQAMQIRIDDADSLGNAALAIATYRELLAAQDESPGPKHSNTINTAWNLEAELIAIGQRDEAARVRARYVTPLLEAPAATLDEDMLAFAAEIRRTEAEEVAAAAKKAVKR